MSGYGRPEGAKKERVIYAEPMGVVEREKRRALFYAALSAAAIAICIAFIVIALKYYLWLLSFGALLVAIAIIFCIWELYVSTEQYLTRTRFRVYEYGLVPTHIPLSYAVNRRAYVIPFTRLAGMSFARRQKGNKTEWKCTITLKDGTPIEFLGDSLQDEFYGFLKSVKDSYFLGESEETGSDGEDVKGRLKKGYKEQLSRWGVGKGR